MSNKKENIGFLLSFAGKSIQTTIIRHGINGYYFDAATHRNVGCHLENGVWVSDNGKTWNESDPEYKYEDWVMPQGANVSYASDVKNGLHVNDDGTVCFGVAYEDINKNSK